MLVRDLDDLGTLLAAGFPAPDAAAAEAARERQAQLTKPPGSLGRLEDIAVAFAGWQGRAVPRIDRAQALVFAGNHGVCAQGINAFPAEVTALMVANFAAGGAAINQLCRAAGADLEVVALELQRPTGDFTQGAAMTAAEVVDALNRGAAAVDPGADVLIVGEMGIGNSTVAAVQAAAVFGGEPSDWTGPGTGLDPAGVRRKAEVVAAGIALHRPDPADAGGILSAFGGREQAAMLGAILAARRARVPVILDGFICTATAGLLAPHAGALDHCIAGHVSAEPGHRRMLDRMGMVPLLDLGMRLGEGSGAAVALGVVRAAIEAHAGMATFAEAGIGGA